MEFYTTKYVNELIKKEYFNFINKHYADILANPNKYINLVQKKISAYLGGGFTKLLDSGTTALQFGLLSLGVGEGDEVIIPANVYSATAVAITNIGAIPVFCDINLDNYTISILDLEKKITKKTKVIIAVHLYGYNCFMKEIMCIAKKNGLKVLEDASHCFGGEYFGKKLGTIGDVGAFSCHLSKNFGTFGRGGIFFTKNKDLYEKINNYIYPDTQNKNILLSGRTPANIGAMDSLVLLFKLDCIDKVIYYNIGLFEYYTKKYSNFDLRLPKLDFLNNKLCIRNFTVLLKKRDLFLEKGLGKQFYDIDLSQSLVFKKFYLGKKLENTQIFFEENFSFSFYFGIK